LQYEVEGLIGILDWANQSPDADSREGCFRRDQDGGVGKFEVLKPSIVVTTALLIFDHKPAIERSGSTSLWPRAVQA